MKAMNCPGHMLVFASDVRSYRDLPLRFHEQTPLHRNEASGVLSGLTRVRQFSQDDAHCFVMESQIGEEVERLLRLVQRVYGDFGLRSGVKLVDAAGGVPRRDRDVGPRRGGAEARARRGRRAVHGQRGRRRLLRPEDRLRRHRRDRPQVAVRDDPARLPDAAAVRPEVHGRRQRRASSRRHPPRDLRRLRAVHRAADRALRRRVPAVARTGAGDGAPNCRPPRRLRGRSVERRLADAGLRVTLDERQEKVGTARSAKRSCRRSVHAGGRRSRSARPRVGARDGSSPRRRCRRCARSRVSSSTARARIEPRGGGSSVRPGHPRPRHDDRVRINERIRVREGAGHRCTGGGSGIIAPQHALRIAREESLDLVEVSASGGSARLAGIMATGAFGTGAEPAADPEAPEDDRGRGDQVRPRSMNTTTSSESASSASWPTATR